MDVIVNDSFFLFLCRIRQGDWWVYFFLQLNLRFSECEGNSFINNRFSSCSRTEKSHALKVIRLWVCFVSGKPLNEYISHYEKLSYDTKHLDAKHLRAKRSIGEEQNVHLKFRSHGEQFHLRLKRDLTTFSDNLEVIHHTEGGIESKRQLDSRHIYEGHVLGDKDSYVHGSISDGIFHGRIVTSKDSYFVEKAQFYFPNHSHVEDGFHSVIYKDQHVNDPYRERRTVHPNGCGLTEDVSHWMDKVQYSGDEDLNVVLLAEKKNLSAENIGNHYQHINNRIYEDHHFAHQKYSEEANNRTKRAATSARYQERNTCSLYIQTDPLIWRHIRESIPDVNFYNSFN